MLGTLPSFGVNSLVVGLGALLVWYVASSIISHRRLSHIPGPRLWSWSALPCLQLHRTGTIFEQFHALNQQYGPLVRIAPNTLLTSDAEVLRRMSATKSEYTRAPWYIGCRLTPGVDNVLSTTDERYHEELRRRMAAGFSGKENLNLEKDIDDCLRELFHLIKLRYLSTSELKVPMDLAQKIQYFTCDVMSKLCFDAKFGDLRDDNDNLDYIHEMETLYPNIFCSSVVPKLISVLTNTGVLAMLAPKANSKMGMGRVLAISKEQVAKRYDEQGNHKIDLYDMVGSFMRHGLSRREVEEETVLTLGAGADTTATALRSTVVGILGNPRVYARLRSEISQAVAQGLAPSGEDEIISDLQARQLPYLQACIKEGLRVYPPIAGLLAKQVPAGGDYINGIFVPGGTSIGYSAKAIHRSPELFGPDAEAFRPERWIASDQDGDEPSREKITRMERNNDLCFGYGRYQCMGRSVATMELNKLAFELLRRFDITLTNPQEPLKSRCFGIHFQSDMMVNVRKRSRELVD